MRLVGINLLASSIIMMLIAAPFQYWLSKFESPYPGLILPALAVYRFTVPLFFGALTSLSSGNLWISFARFMVAILPTGILVLIYYLTRKKMKKRNEIEQMKIQDL